VLSVYSRVAPGSATAAGSPACRFMTPDGRLGAAHPCSIPLLLLAHGTARWSLRLTTHLPPGHYTVSVGAVDTHGLRGAGLGSTGTLSVT
jgi:hypothetical protein